MFLRPLLILLFAGASAFTVPSTSRFRLALKAGEGEGKTLVVAGASGYIGKSTVKEAVRYVARDDFDTIQRREEGRVRIDQQGAKRRQRRSKATRMCRSCTKNILNYSSLRSSPPPPLTVLRLLFETIQRRSSPPPPPPFTDKATKRSPSSAPNPPPSPTPPSNLTSPVPK